MSNKAEKTNAAASYVQQLLNSKTVNYLAKKPKSKAKSVLKLRSEKSVQACVQEKEKVLVDVGTGESELGKGVEVQKIDAANSPIRDSPIIDQPQKI